MMTDGLLDGSCQNMSVESRQCSFVSFIVIRGCDYKILIRHSRNFSVPASKSVQRTSSAPILFSRAGESNKRNTEQNERETK